MPGLKIFEWLVKHEKCECFLLYNFPLYRKLNACKKLTIAIWVDLHCDNTLHNYDTVNTIFGDINMHPT